jgi:hypothetical protein
VVSKGQAGGWKLALGAFSPSTYCGGGTGDLRTAARPCLAKRPALSPNRLQRACHVCEDVTSQPRRRRHTHPDLTANNHGLHLPVLNPHQSGNGTSMYGPSPLLPGNACIKSDFQWSDFRDAATASRCFANTIRTSHCSQGSASTAAELQWAARPGPEAALSETKWREQRTRNGSLTSEASSDKVERFLHEYTQEQIPYCARKVNITIPKAHMPIPSGLVNRSMFVPIKGIISCAENEVNM